MAMIVREMILLDQASFQPDDPHDFNDDSGWLGPPRAVPFAWELAPGTPKQERKPDSTPDEVNCREIVKVGSPGGDELGWREAEEEQDRRSLHILENAPQSFLASRSSEALDEFIVDHHLKGRRAVAFKWEMEPGIPRDPTERPHILDCPLTPPPVFHPSRSMVVHSSSSSLRTRKPSTLSLSQRLRSLLWIQPQRQQQQHHDFRMRLNPQGRRSPLLLKNSPHNASKKSAASIGGVGAGHSDVEEDDLSPVSVLDYSGSTRSGACPVDSSGSNRRLSSASSSTSRRSHYHTPNDSFCGADAGNCNLSPSGSFKSAKNTDTGGRSALSTLLLRRRHGKTGCFMPRSNSFATTNDSFEEAASEVNSSSERSSSLSSDVSGKKPGNESPDDDARSVYYSPAPHHSESPRQSFSFPRQSFSFPSGAGDEATKPANAGIDRVDSLETIDPGFAPSEIGDECDQHNFTILNRMTSCARLQRKTIKQQRSNQLAKSLFGRVTVCCYVPREDQC